MATINAIQCGTDAKNTGICNCFLDPKLITGAILIPKTRVLSQAEIDDIQDTLEDLTLATKANRIFPIQNFVSVTDNSEDPTNQTFGYGSIEPVREGNYNLVFQFRQGGLNLSNNLRSFNGLTAKYAVLFIENQNTLIGTSKADVNGADGIAGVPLEVLYTFPWKVNDGTNLASYRIQFGFRPEYVNENIAFARIDTTTYMLTELTGLEDIVLTQGTLSEANDTVLITAKTDCGSTDLYDLYADELNTATAWVVKNADGDTITVTVAKDADAKGWVLTYSTDEITNNDTVTLAAPSVLAAAPISVVGYEANTVTLDFGS